MASRTFSKPSSSPRGLFMLFVLALFFLQIVFAFTIHGDIGPQSPIVPGLDRPASPLLVGRIDTLITQPCTKMPVRPVPEALLAPATREVPSAMKAVETMLPVREENSEKPILCQTGGRFLSYTVVKGDTLEEIAKKLFGSTAMITSLVRINRIQDDRKLQLGQVLSIPRTGILATALPEQ